VSPAQLPSIECWANQFSHYDIRISNSEYTSDVPEDRPPDFGTFTIHYRPTSFASKLKMR